MSDQSCLTDKLLKLQSGSGTKNSIMKEVNEKDEERQYLLD